MRAVPGVAVLLTFAGRAAAVRNMDASSVVAVSEARAGHAERWCLTSLANPRCEEGTVLEIRSAFTSAAWPDCGAPPARDEERCEPDVTEAVTGMCKGQQECSIPPEAELSCTEKTQHSLRVTWDCVPGAPLNAAFTKLDPVDEAQGARRQAPGREDDAEELDKAKSGTAVEEDVEGKPRTPTACPGSYRPGVSVDGGLRPVTFCKDVDTEELAEKVCCEQTLTDLEKAVDACQEVPDWHCKPDDGTAFKSKRSKYPEVPAAFVCRRMYACTFEHKVIGYLETVKECGDMRGVARKACVPEEKP